MWLLSTDRAELHFFTSPEAVDGGYAILSHTWGHGDSEQSFQEILVLNRRCKETGANPRDSASDKIRACCQLAESHGYRWVWIDTCCIDKTSSTELSEAINSMFRWYSCAEVCYAFMEDVPSDDILEDKESAFRTSRWHRRGWTLQELIAPALVIFVSQDWQTLGNKIERASLLQEITGIWWQVLTREVHFSVISVAQRMSWASRRGTTRIEDEAYCLMGLFTVNMPTIYGEGRQAFQRLQHEIMKHSFDTSLFAWGRWINAESLTPMAHHEIYQHFNTSSQNHVYLLAHSPHSFYRPFGGSIVRFTPSATYPLQPYLPWQWKKNQDEPEDSERRTVGPFGRLELPRFAFTSHGVKCRFPIIEVDGLTIAVLLCDTGHLHVGLILHPSNMTIRDPSRPMYNAGFGFRVNGGLGFARLISLGKDLYNLCVNGKTVKAEWHDIFIADSAPPMRKDEALSLLCPLNCIVPNPPFRMPHWLIGRLTMMGLEPRPLHIAGKPSEGRPLLVVVTFEDVNAREGLRIMLGMCTQSEEPLHWAKAMPQYHVNWGTRSDLTHDCSAHHVKSWGGWSKDFGDAGRTVRLSFTSCKRAPVTTLVLHVELEGSKLTALKERTKVVLPSREQLEKGPKTAITQAAHSDPSPSVDVDVPSVATLNISDNPTTEPPDPSDKLQILPIATDPPSESITRASSDS